MKTKKESAKTNETMNAEKMVEVITADLNVQHVNCPGSDRIRTIRENNSTKIICWDWPTASDPSELSTRSSSGRENRNRTGNPS